MPTDVIPAANKCCRKIVNKHKFPVGMMMEGMKLVGIKYDKD